VRDSPTLHKFPVGSTNRDYDIFEEMPDGQRLWRARVVGQWQAERKLQELAEHSENEFVAVDILGDEPRSIDRSKKTKAQTAKAASG